MSRLLHPTDTALLRAINSSMDMDTVSHTSTGSTAIDIPYPRLLPLGARNRLTHMEAVSAALRNDIDRALQSLRRSSQSERHRGEIWACCWTTLQPSVCANHLNNILREWRNNPSPEAARRVRELARALHTGISMWLTRATVKSESQRTPSTVTPQTSPSSDATSDNSSDNSSAESHSSAATPRPDNWLVTERDGQCLITNAKFALQHCHIFAYALGKHIEPDVKQQFWKFLTMFAGPETTQKVQQYLLSTIATENGRTCINRLENMITLSPVAHQLFDSGGVILEPVGDPLSALAPGEQLTNYDVQFSYLWKQHEATKNHAGTLTTNTPADVDFCLLSSQNNVPAIRTTGDIITLTTSDPVVKPLPHPDLLALHAAISKLLKMAGRSGPRDPFDDDEDDDPVDKIKNIVSWQKQVVLELNVSTSQFEQVQYEE